MPDLAVLPDDRRPLDQDAGFNGRAFPDENPVSDAGAGEPFGWILSRRPGEIIRDILERLPSVSGAVEDRGMVGLGQIKQISGSKHTSNLRQTPAPAKAIGTSR